jgi:hypothetical protein
MGANWSAWDPNDGRYHALRKWLRNLRGVPQLGELGVRQRIILELANQTLKSTE